MLSYWHYSRTKVTSMTCDRQNELRRSFYSFRLSLFLRWRHYKHLTLPRLFPAAGLSKTYPWPPPVRLWLSTQTILNYCPLSTEGDCNRRCCRWLFPSTFLGPEERTCNYSWQQFRPTCIESQAAFLDLVKRTSNTKSRTRLQFQPRAAPETYYTTLRKHAKLTTCFTPRA